MKFKKEELLPNNAREYTERTIYVPCEDHTHYEVLKFLHDYGKLASDMAWNAGPKNFTVFRSCLYQAPDLEEEWETFETQANTQTMATFAATKTLFKDKVLEDLHYHSQLEYMRNLKKPGPLSVSDFMRDLRALNRLAPQFPDANGATGLDDEEFKRVFFKAMPKAWQDKFHACGKEHFNLPLNEIVDCMKIQEKSDPYDPKKTANSNATNNTNGSNNASRNTGSRRGRSNSNRGNQQRNSNNNNNNNNGGNSNSNRSNQRGTNSNQNNNSNRNRTRIQPDDPCPLPGHESHIWYDCQQNRHGRHGDDTRRPSNQSNGNGGNGGNSGHNHENNSNEADFEAHFMDASDDSPIGFDDPLDDYMNHIDGGECFHMELETIDESDDES
jgi:hypothetical protein